MTARRLLREYARGLSVDRLWQVLEQARARWYAGYSPLRGCVLLARWQHALAGSVGLRGLSRHTCEMKRLYVRPVFRGFGLGRTLVEAILREGRALGYRRVRLDTLPSMEAARSLYASCRFRPIPPYYDNPLPGVLYLERAL